MLTTSFWYQIDLKIIKYRSYISPHEIIVSRNCNVMHELPDFKVKPKSEYYLYCLLLSTNQKFIAAQFLHLPLT